MDFTTQEKNAISSAIFFMLKDTGLGMYEFERIGQKFGIDTRGFRFMTQQDIADTCLTMSPAKREVAKEAIAFTYLLAMQLVSDMSYQDDLYDRLKGPLGMPDDDF